VFSKPLISLCWFWVYSFRFLSVPTTTWRIFPNDFFTLALRCKHNLHSLHSQRSIVIFPRLGFSQWTFIILNPVQFSHRDSPQWGPGPPHYRALPMTLRHTKIGRAPLDEWLAGRSLYLTQDTTLTRNSNLNKRATADPRVRPRSNWLRPFSILPHGKLISTESSAASSITF
jgi:hypothetical protein